MNHRDVMNGRYWRSRPPGNGGRSRRKGRRTMR